MQVWVRVSHAEPACLAPPSLQLSLWCIHVNTLPPCSCIHCAVDFLTSVVAEQQTAEKGFEEQKNQLRFLTNVKSDGLGWAVFGADAGE